VGAWITTHTITHLAEINEVTLRAMKLRKGVSAQTRINDMAAVSSFLGYLVERRILSSNPLQGMSCPQRDIRMPRVLTPEQAQALLEAARTEAGGRLLRYFALCLLAGLRPGEAAALDPAQVNTGPGGRIAVVTSKRRRRGRAVPVNAPFRAWWKVAPPTPAPLFDWVRDRVAFDAIRTRAGLIERGQGGDRKRLKIRLWQDDICRHTWISWRLAETQNEAQVALEAGTSVHMIHEHYLQWLDARAVKALARIRPESSIATGRKSTNPRPRPPRAGLLRRAPAAQTVVGARARAGCRRHVACPRPAECTTAPRSRSAAATRGED